ncbi:MAG: hypothetical protein N4A48_06360 [Tepidibacter sp.]|jgi:hypothetical protein|uniref:hypothetical protein n=1 Tax=Tepidibacter sp. TaxID=2529387 RepID=UPI0025EAA494|nr:hypothetical protein [Tepidibacter sp.]MCT4508373.1 hypothetical protein [Tepidibacter sp.]
MSCGCCELIKTKRVMCEEEVTFPGSFPLCPITVANDPDDTTDQFTVDPDVEGTSNILCTGCDLEVNGCVITVTVKGFLLDEKLTLVGTGDDMGLTQEVDIPIARICEQHTFTLGKCKISDACKENLQCQLFSITAENAATATLSGTGNNEITITQTISNIQLTIKINQEVQLLVQLCSNTGGRVTINPT